MSEGLEQTGSNSLESIKSLLNESCWTEYEKSRGSWLMKGDRESLIFLCQFLRNEVTLSMEKVDDSTSLGNLKSITTRFNTINECISLLDDKNLKPLTLSEKLTELSHLLRVNENIISPIIIETRESVGQVLQ